MERTKSAVSVLAVVLLADYGVARAQELVGSAFTYQGELKKAGLPVDETADFEFSLWNDPNSADPNDQVGSTFAVSNQVVDEGLFTVVLDFGADIFTGQARWLEIKVRSPAGSGEFATLSTRQELTPAPYALALPGLWTQENATSPNLIGGFSGNVVDVGVTGATVSGGGVAGMANRVTDGHGTVGGGRGNRAGDNDGDPNDARCATVAGGQQNIASGWVAAVGGGFSNTATTRATVSGGAENDATGGNSAIGGGVYNLASGSSAVIGGGGNNTASNSYATVGGGSNNEATGGYATIAGGVDNSAGWWATVGGGVRNQAADEGDTVGGGEDNIAGGYWSTVSGGLRNTADTGSVVAGGQDNNASNGGVVGGGFDNEATGYWATVSGGWLNIASEQTATIAGGYGNSASAGHATVAGGWLNTASGPQSAVGGGSVNVASGQDATVPGGSSNEAAGTCSFAAGYRAKADHSGTFVWADSTSADFASTWPNQFIIRAANGVGIGTNDPQAMLHVAGTAGVDGIMFPDGTLQTTAAAGGGGGDIGGSGTTDYLAKFTATNAIGDSVLYEDSAGNVGIGTASPQGILDVVGGPGTDILIGVNDAGGRIIGTDADGNLNLKPRLDGQGVIVRDGNTPKGIMLYGGGVNRIQSVDIDGVSPFTLSVNADGGNVGIGTMTPSAKLHVAGGDIRVDADGRLLVDAESGRQIELRYDPNTATGHLNAAARNLDVSSGWTQKLTLRGGSQGIAFNLQTSSGDDATKMRLNHAGQFGIGTNSPQARLHVAGTPGVDGIMFPDGTLQTTAAPGGGGGDIGGSGTTNYLAKFTATNAIGDSVLYEDAGGNVGVGTSNPARELEVAGTARVEALELYADAGLRVNMWADATDGAVVHIAGPDGTGYPGDKGLELRGASNGGGQLLAYNGANAATLEIDGDDGSGGSRILLSDGTTATVNMDGSAGDVEARSLSVTDTFGGADRAKMTGLSTGGWIQTFNSSGIETVWLGSPLLQSGQIAVNDSSGSTKVLLDGDSAATGGKLTLHNANGNAGLEAQGGASGNGAQLEMRKASGTLVHRLNAGDHQISTFGTDGQERMRLWSDSWGSLFLWDQTNDQAVVLTASDESGGELELADANGNVTVRLDGDSGGSGRVITQVLEITGGSDLSEQFDVSVTEGQVEAGMVVCIDPQNPGGLVVSSKAYDRTVAGVISGAGGVAPGMLMRQAGSKADGADPVALTGRVYVWADASTAAIAPGDLLTTSEIPGHAEKVTDYARAQGAIIGKAMTSLSDGKGLVLVLVSLQ